MTDSKPAALPTVFALDFDPHGLIATDTETGEQRFVPSASKSGWVLGKTV